MQRYFGHINHQSVELTDEDIHHILHVMRMKKGDEFELVDNQRLYVCQIQNTQPFTAIIVNEVKSEVEIEKNVTLFFPLAKGDKIDLVIQKATEIGVHKIVLFKSKRCIVSLDEDSFNKKKVRYQKIAKEASEQCHRLIVPEIIGIVDINHIPSELKEDINYIAYEKNSGSTKESFYELNNKQSVSIVIGPEGGFEEKEVETLVNQGFKIVSLGKRILRCETAAIYAMSVISYKMEQ
ncbi:MAG: 16S rRNA (uracil(1498)-N(3))-methyltransferase [Bacilli bacterium]|nr:16S rRNA (uracil(1498)-N(3))-methyltransferase [Bacilli bacterium]